MHFARVHTTKLLIRAIIYICHETDAHGLFFSLFFYPLSYDL